MVEEAAPQRGERVRVEREGTPSISLPVDARLRSWVGRGYGGFDEASMPPGDFVIPAMLVTPLAVKVRD